MILQFALSTDDPYPSSNWIIVLHGLSVREARVSICAGGKYGWWNGSSFLLHTFELYFILGLSLPDFLKLGKNGEGGKGIEMAVPEGSIFG